MPETKPVSAKYLFLDVVGFTHKRSVEAQTDIVGTLNELVSQTLSELQIQPDKTILLPTGDGLCIALIQIEEPYDILLRVALRLLDELAKHNEQTQDPTRQFEIRIGLNANVDNLVPDINGRQNIAGAGINTAQRVMSLADGNQILVGQTVFDLLSPREEYMRAFHSYQASVKHDRRLRVHQYIEPNRASLNVEPPSSLVPKEKTALSDLVGYYIAHALENQEHLVSANRLGSPSISAVNLLYVLAKDSVGYSKATNIKPYTPQVWNAGTASFEKQLQHFDSQDFAVTYELSDLIGERFLAAYSDCFEFVFPFWLFISEEGRRRLKDEQPGIWKEFNFEDP